MNTAEKIIDISAYGYEFTSRSPRNHARTVSADQRRSGRKTARRNMSAREYYNRAYSTSEAKRTKRIPSSASNPRKKRSVRQLLIGMLFGFLIAVITVLLFMKFTAHSVSANEQRTAQKYYKSVQLDAGDTLWDLADTEMSTGYSDKQEFIHEVETINHIDANDIHSGARVIIPYFA